MKLKIISDGTHKGTQVVEAETGKPIEGVRAVRWVAGFGDIPKAFIEVVDAEIEAVVEGKVKADMPLATMLKCDACGSQLFTLPPEHEYASCFNGICRNSKSRRKRPTPAREAGEKTGYNPRPPADLKPPPPPPPPPPSPWPEPVSILQRPPPPPSPPPARDLPPNERIAENSDKPKAVEDWLAPDLREDYLQEDPGVTFAPPCPRCGFSQKRRFWIFGRILGCYKPICANFHGRKQ